MYVPLVLTQFLDRAVKLYGTKTAVIDDNRIVSYADLHDRVNRLANGLNSLDIQKGDRIAYLAPNTLEMLEGFYGVFQLGAVMVPLNVRLMPEDYLFILNHSESSLLFVDYELYSFIQPIRQQLKTVRKIIVHGGNKIDLYNNDIDYESWLSTFSHHLFSRAELDETDLATLLYTSGTTGDPKGVMLSHRSNYLHALWTMHHLHVSDRDVLLHILPMFHVNGWGSPFYYTANGATHVTLRKVKPETIFDKIKQHDVSIMHMAPTVLHALLQYHDQHQLNLKQKIRVVIAGSAPPPSFVSRVEKDLGWEFIQVYGMTETSPLFTTSQIRVHHQHLPEKIQYEIKAKAGYPMIGCEVKVVTENGEEVKPDGKEIGEIITRHNGVMDGYWKNKDATMAAIRNGWMYTGDMGTIDEYGNIEIVDRKKDIIISGGENISSIEVEGILYEHPAVIEAAIVAIPHEKWGETPHAIVVVAEDKSVTGEELIQFTRERVAHFKAPTSVSFVDELPKTASGKIQKVQLRDQFWKSTRKIN